jgi:hypothetical protein
VHPDRPVELRHAREHRLEARVVGRAAVHVRVDLNAERAQLADRPVDLGQRGIDVVDRHAGHEAEEGVGPIAHQLGQRVVGQPGQLDGLGGPTERFDRWCRETDDLRVVLERLDHAQALINVVERADRRRPLEQVGRPLRGDLLEAVVVGPREDVAEGVDLHSASASEVSGLAGVIP